MKSKIEATAIDVKVIYNSWGWQTLFEVCGTKWQTKLFKERINAVDAGDILITQKIDHANIALGVTA